MTPAQVCTCRALDLWVQDESRKRTLVFLTPRKDLKDVKAIVGTSMPAGTKCHGAIWESPNGDSVIVREFGTDPLVLEGGFDLTVCNGGEPSSKEEGVNLRKWRASAQ